MTTSPIGMYQNGDTNHTPGFTLVELILVMALMIMMAALAAPSLSRSFRQHVLEQEAARLLALTEYGREEAISQGVPMDIWIEPSTGRYGMGIRTGYSGNASRNKEFSLNPDTHFELAQASAAQQGIVDAVEFDPDGVPDPASVTEIRLVDRFDSVITVSQTTDGWGYEIVKGGQ